VSDYDSDCRSLEIEPGASPEEVRQAYLDQTKIWHPDRFSNDIRLQKKAEEKLKQINLAYQRLCEDGPYEPPVLNRSTKGSPSEWVAVFVALRRALMKSVLAITRPFRLLMAKTGNLSNKVFQWCRLQRRSLAIATIAFVLGFALGGWLLSRESEAWAKINNLRQGIIERAQGTAQVAGAKPSSTAIATSSSPPIARPSGDVFPWKTDVVTTVFWVGEEQSAEKTSPQHQSVWDKDWLKNFGGVDNPEPAARHDYIPISFVPRQNPFYCALPYNDVEQGRFKPEAPVVIPWFKQVHAEPVQSVCKDHWVAIRKEDRICYAQWEDCGPFRTDHFQYVFQNERPTPNARHGAGLSVSPAVRDYLGLASVDVTDWRFVEVTDVPLGPWRDYGENNPFVIAHRPGEENFRKQERFAESAATKPEQSPSPPREDIMLPSPVELDGFAEQEGSANPAEIEPAQGISPADEDVFSPPAERPDKGVAELKTPATQGAAQRTQARRAPGERVMSRAAAKAVTTYAPRPPYPQEARSRRIAGSGLCVVSVDPASGSVTEASMAQSTGSPLLDKSTLRTVRTWKFKPGTVSKVSIPVEFTTMGNNQ
jgi:TonB family protein